MLATVEKAIILKTVDIFRELPNSALSQIATLMEEVEVGAGEALFSEGDRGDCLYIIVTGTIHIHQGQHTLSHLDEYAVFGEMALVESEPRLASATAVTDCLLLRLDQEPFYELLEGRGEVVRGIVHVLAQRLYAVMTELDRLDGAD